MRTQYGEREKTSFSDAYRRNVLGREGGGCGNCGCRHKVKAPGRRWACRNCGALLDRVRDE